MIVLHTLVFLVGVTLVVRALFSAVRTFVVPRGSPDRLTGIVFVVVRRAFGLALWRARSYHARDRVMAYFAPVSLLLLPAVWLTFVLVGYTAIFWATSSPSWNAALLVSGSSLLTLGSASASGPAATMLTFTEAVFGLTLAALLVSYLPTMYAAFARREAMVTGLETRAGSPPSAITMLVRLHRIGRLDHVGETWGPWETWFEDIEESHTSLQALVFYRSPQPDRSWVTAAGTVLDAAALVSSTLDLPRDAPAELCIRAGYLSLRRISDLFGIAYDPNPQPGDPISVTREEYDAACATLIAEGVALKQDRDQAWRDFVGWRVNYDTVLLALADLTMAPIAPWSSDRARHQQTMSYHERAKRIYHTDAEDAEDADDAEDAERTDVARQG